MTNKSNNSFDEYFDILQSHKNVSIDEMANAPKQAIHHKYHRLGVLPDLKIPDDFDEIEIIEFDNLD